MTNLEGRRKYGDDWKGMDETDLRAYVGLLILAGVYRSRGEAATSLWDAESGWAIFLATMPLKVFHTYSRLLRFDDREMRRARRVVEAAAPLQPGARSDRGRATGSVQSTCPASQRNMGSSRGWPATPNPATPESRAADARRGTRGCGSWSMSRRDCAVATSRATITSPPTNSRSSSWRGRSPWSAQFGRTSPSS